MQEITNMKKKKMWKVADKCKAFIKIWHINIKFKRNNYKAAK